MLPDKLVVENDSSTSRQVGCQDKGGPGTIHEVILVSLELSRSAKHLFFRIKYKGSLRTVLKLAFLMFRSGNHFETLCRGLGTDV